MQHIQSSTTNSQKLRGANATFLDHYAQWASHMLTLTFADNKKTFKPSSDQIDKLLQHLKSTLNWDVWKKRTKYNAKAKILYIPIVEGMNGERRAHIHILLGNIKDEVQLHRFITSYIAGSAILGAQYDIEALYDTDGIGWYLTKETHKLNTDAVRWNAALIPAALVPKASTLLRA